MVDVNPSDPIEPNPKQASRQNGRSHGTSSSKRKRRRPPNPQPMTPADEPADELADYNEFADNQNDDYADIDEYADTNDTGHHLGPDEAHESLIHRKRRSGKQPNRRFPAPARQAAKTTFQWASHALPLFEDGRDLHPTGWEDGRSAILHEDDSLLMLLVQRAQDADSPGQAAALVAAAVPLALRLHPNIYRHLWPALPALVQGMVGLTQMLYHRSVTRPLIQEIPSILQQAIELLSREPAPLDPSKVARLLATTTQTVLSRALDDDTADQDRARRARPRRGVEQEWWDDEYF